MTIPSHEFSVFSTNGHSLRETVKIEGGVQNSIDMRESSFAVILAQIAAKADNGNENSCESILLKKKLISELLVKIKTQIDNQLWRIVADEEDHFDPNISFLGRSAAPEFLPIQNTPSNISQVTHNNDREREADDLYDIIEQASRAYGVDKRLIHSVIKAESGYKSQSTSEKGAMGLMQLMPDTARELGVHNPYDSRENIMGGTRYLKNLLDRYRGNWALALAAYNWGMGNLEKNPEQLPQETSRYISRVFRYYNELGT